LPEVEALVLCSTIYYSSSSFLKEIYFDLTFITLCIGLSDTFVGSFSSFYAFGTSYAFGSFYAFGIFYAYFF
jgi:hypothetical protein